MKLTLPQQDVYFEQLLYPKAPIYNIGAKIAIKGNIVYDLLNKAYIALIDQHDAYRSIVINNGTNAEIEILEKHDSVLDFMDFSKEPRPDEMANEFMEETFVRAFDLSSGKLLHKFILIKVGDMEYYLFSMYHHIITDGWGTSLMFQRLIKNYNELSGLGHIITEYPYSYKDFVINDSEYQSSKDYTLDKIYWKEKFKELPERIFEKNDETLDINQSERKEFVIDRSMYDSLESLAKKYRSSTFHIILSILYLYFGRKHENSDFAIGLPVLNRSKSIFKKTVGLFMGVSALRISLDFEDTFENLINNVKQQLRQDYRHQRFPLGKLIQELNLFQDKDRLFNMTLSYEKQNYADDFVNTKTKVVPLTHRAERVALAIYIREFDASEDVKIDFDYNVNYFDQDKMDRIIGHIARLIPEVIADPQKKLYEYKYLTREEEEVLHSFNRTRFSYPKGVTFLSRFEKQVQIAPGHIAVKNGIKQYSYGELDRFSNRVANFIMGNTHKQTNSPVALLMHRGPEFLVALIGILKAGKPYIPLDPEFPEERLRYIMAHSNVDTLITSREIEFTVEKGVSRIDLETIDYWKKTAIGYTKKHISAKDVAYLIYTSGSTGNPKGVVVQHQALMNFLLSMKDRPGIAPNDLLFSVTTPSFDISILEFLVPLISGATVHITDKDTLRDPLEIIKELEETQPTIIQATPSFYQMLYNAGWNGDKKLKILCGGDLLSESLAERLIADNAEVWNMYGPTETTIWSSIKPLKISKDASNIGSPIHNTRFYILDRHLQLLPIGCRGSIYIGGHGLAKEYYKNRSLTVEKFIQNPFYEEEKIYETGDVGKWNSYGEIEFLGRNDYQVKIRGYRIELGEIETKLNQIEAVKSSVAIVHEKSDQEAFLIAYIIAKKEILDTSYITKALRKELPEYMVPNMILSVGSFPLTPNAKVDRKKMSQWNIDNPEAVTTDQKPRTAIEKAIHNFYCEILGVRNIGVEDNFFALGGHSLNAVKLIGQIHKFLGYRIALKAIFDYPTITGLSNYLEQVPLERDSPITRVEEEDFYPVSFPQYAMWLAARQEEISIAYNMPAVYKIKGEIEKEPLKASFLNVIKKYEVLRTNFIEIQGYPYMKIRPFKDVIFDVKVFSVDNSKIYEAVQEYITKEFDLENEMLIRVGLFMESGKNDTSCIVFNTHHVIMDGWSIELLIDQIVRNYKSLTSGESLPKNELNFQYRDYVVWQNNKELKEKKNNHKFWDTYLKDYRWKNLASDLHRTDGENALGATHYFKWNASLLERMKEVSVEKNSTLYALLVSTFNLLLFNIYGLKDICIGVVNSGRSFAELHAQIGMFVKTLPLRTKIDSKNSFIELLDQVQHSLLLVDKYQDIPESIRNTLRLEILLVMQNPEFNHSAIEVHKELELELCPMNSKYSRLPMLINFSIENDRLCGTVAYNKNKYQRETIEFLISRYKELLEQIIQDPKLLIHALENDDSSEKEDTIDIIFEF